MLKKIFERLNSINSFSKKIIIWGCAFSLILCLMGVAIIEYNNFNLNQFSTYNVGSTMVYTSIVMFAQIIVGSLLIDFFGTLISNHE